MMDFVIMRPYHRWKSMLTINKHSITHITKSTDLRGPLNIRALTNMKATYPMIKL